MTMPRKVAHFSGRVQGVGFRYTTRNLALQYNVHGYVKNLPDGRVELVVEGDENEIDHFLNDLRDRMQPFITRVDLSTCPATGEFQHFCIKHS